MSFEKYEEKICTINAKLANRRKIRFPYPDWNQTEDLFARMVAVPRPELLDRLKKLIKFGKRNRHFR